MLTIASKRWCSSQTVCPLPSAMCAFGLAGFAAHVLQAGKIGKGASACRDLGQAECFARKLRSSYPTTSADNN